MLNKLVRKLILVSINNSNINVGQLIRYNRNSTHNYGLAFYVSVYLYAGKFTMYWRWHLVHYIYFFYER